MKIHQVLFELYAYQKERVVLKGFISSDVMHRKSVTSALISVIYITDDLYLLSRL